MFSLWALIWHGISFATKRLMQHKAMHLQNRLVSALPNERRTDWKGPTREGAVNLEELPDSLGYPAAVLVEVQTNA
jgi:hypothetical protein